MTLRERSNQTAVLQETVEALQSAMGAEAAAPPSPASAAQGPWGPRGDPDGPAPTTWALVQRVVQLTSLVNSAERTVALALGSQGLEGVGAMAPTPRVDTGTVTDSQDFEQHVHAECRVSWWGPGQH